MRRNLGGINRIFEHEKMKFMMQELMWCVTLVFVKRFVALWPLMLVDRSTMTNICGLHMRKIQVEVPTNPAASKILAARCVTEKLHRKVVLMVRFDMV